MREIVGIVKKILKQNNFLDHNQQLPIEIISISFPQKKAKHSFSRFLKGTVNRF